MNALALPTVILREPAEFWAELREGQGLGSKCTALAIVSVTSLAIFGAIMGSSNSAAQASASAIKLPILYLATMMICFPTLHIFKLLFGSKHSPMQLLTLLMATMAITSLLVLAFAPISAFFVMSSTNYQFVKLLNVGILGLSAVLGIRFFYRGIHALAGEDSSDASTLQASNASTPEHRNTGMARSTREQILRGWILLYAFVGTQLAWTLRPFFGAPDQPFEWTREVGGTFYTDVFRALGELFGG